jgi:drug/metabolite transporter (DMT)-like permease
VIALILLAAVLHALWNALIRSGADRLWSITYMTITTAAVSAIGLFWLGLPAAASRPYAVLSGVLHLGYALFLSKAYRVGDLGQTYPIARGSSPLLIALGAAVLAGEHLNGPTFAGVALVSGGIMSLALDGRRLAVPSIPAALGTGCFIAAYSVTDGMGVRVSGNSLSYTALVFFLWGILVPPVFVAARGWTSLRGTWQEAAKAAGGGIISLFAYGVVIWAMQLGAMGTVSALRETSVVFAALLGRCFLRERLTPQRIAACLVIAGGAICLGYHR